MIRKIYIFGDSHTDALKKALKISDSDLGKVEIKIYRYSKIKDGRSIGDINEKEILEIVSRLGLDDLVVSAVGGNQHQVVSLIQHPFPYDFYSLETPTLPTDLGKSIVPYNQFFDYFWKGIVNGKEGKRLLDLKSHAPCRFVHLVPPPPKKETSHIIKFHETHFAKNGLPEKGVSAPELRFRVWKLQAEVLRKFSYEHGFELLDPPKETVDQQGFLINSFYANDATHANLEYGRIVLKQLVSL